MSRHCSDSKQRNSKRYRDTHAQLQLEITAKRIDRQPSEQERKRSEPWWNDDARPTA